MKEQLYTIPVSDAFKTATECPVCAMKKSLEEDAVDFTMGPSYMEDDIRAQTDKIGFCDRHVSLLYKNQNRLGLALMLKTHLDKTLSDLKKIADSDQGKQTASSLFKKKEPSTGIKSYIDSLDSSCFVCSRINKMFDRYIATVFYLYKQEKDFREDFLHSKGLCTRHYGLLYQGAPEHLKGSVLKQFYTDLNQIYFDNMERVKKDLEWFIDKFDYRYTNEPWGTAKDALPRTMLKTNCIMDEEEQ